MHDLTSVSLFVQVQGTSADLGILGAEQAPGFCDRYKVRMQPPQIDSPLKSLLTPPVLLAQIAMRKGQEGQKRSRLAGRTCRGWGQCQRNGRSGLV